MDGRASRSMTDTQGDQKESKESLGHLGMNLQLVVSHHVGVGIEPELWKSN